VTLPDLVVRVFEADALLAGGIEFRLRCAACGSPRRRWRGDWFGSQSRLFTCLGCEEVYPARRRHRPGKSRRP
jgi:hypothetical protein